MNGLALPRGVGSRGGHLAREGQQGEKMVVVSHILQPALAWAGEPTVGLHLNPAQGSPLLSGLK